MGLWNGFRMEEFDLEGMLPGRTCKTIIVYPDEPALLKPWVWRAEFFGAFANADLELVRKGWHIAYCSFSDMYGCPKAVEGMKRFHDWCVKTLGLSPKPVIFGFSRGGLYTVNYVYAYPEDTCCLYIDAPALDIRNWPSGLNSYPRNEEEWERCKELYGLDNETIKTYEESPLNHAPFLAKQGIPVLLVSGDADEAVYYPENGQIFADRYHEAKGKIKVILKPGGKHHPHGLEDTDPIVHFILEQWAREIQRTS
jgi:pimeloyl-ACP methyl ester carboxylesterase